MPAPELSEIALRYRHSYVLSREVSRDCDDWYALLFALIRGADSENHQKLQELWPDEVSAFHELYYAPMPQ